MTGARRTLVPLAIWAALIAVAVVAGLASDAVEMTTPPLAGVFDPRLGPPAAAVVALAVAVVAVGPRLAERAGWPLLLAGSAVAAGLWAVALAAVDGLDAIAGPLAGRHDYLVNLPLPSDFLATFTERIASYTVHAEGHPPGFLLLLSGLDRIGFGGPGPAAALAIAGGAMAIPAALLAVREVADEPAARRAAPFLVLAPAAMWVATSADALYLGVGAWGVALGLLALGRRGWRGLVLGVASGLLLGAALFGSYGMVLLAVVLAPAAIVRRRIGPLLGIAAGTGMVAAAFAAGGFWWPDGLLATIDRYAVGISGDRPYAYFLVGSLAAFALAVGPAAAVGLARLRDARVWLLCGGAVAAVLLADLSGLSKGEVERIWLPFVPWVLLATAPLHAGREGPRPWLGLQAAVALGLQLLVVTPW